MTTHTLIDRLLEELGPDDAERLLRPMLQRIVVAMVAVLVDAELLDARWCPHCSAELLAISSIDGPTVRQCAECREDITTEVFRG